MEKMYVFFTELLGSIGIESFVHPIAYAVCIILIIITCVISRFIMLRIIIKIFSDIAKKAKFEKFNIFIESKLFNRISYLIIPVAVSFFTADIADNSMFWEKSVEISFIVIILMIIDSFFKCINELSSYHRISKNFPVRSILQVVKIVSLIIGGIIGVSILMNQSPAALIGGLGAMTAITTLVFKDAILGFIAGIQLTGNDMIKIGDWIEAPKYSADGTVVDLSITTVKVQNFDKTITSIPAYSLVSDSFINWRGMENSGARRIKRSLYINAKDIRVCDEEMLDKFKRIELLKNYINKRMQEIEKYNSEFKYDLSEITNGRRLTNIGVFRIYIGEYLKRHPHINKDFTLIVRQLEMQDRGVPIEIYAFADTSEWAKYESIQSDIFDHLYAVISEFGLCLHMSPSSSDFSNFVDNN